MADSPISPPAPGRFCTTTGWPNSRSRNCAMVRAEMSVPPPAAKGTINCNGLSGQAARAKCGAATMAPTPAKRPRRFSFGPFTALPFSLSRAATCPAARPYHGPLREWACRQPASCHSHQRAAPNAAHPRADHRSSQGDTNAAHRN